MALRLIQITAHDRFLSQIQEAANANDAADFSYSARNKDGRRTFFLLIELEKQQDLTDNLQQLFSQAKNWRITILPVEATIPRLQPKKPPPGESAAFAVVKGTLTREELYEDMQKGGQPDLNFFILVILSVLVCAIGLISNSVTIIIGAMVIAPMLAPIMALAFGAALGDRKMMSGAIKSNAAGLGLTIALSLGLGLIFTILPNDQLLDRTYIGLESLILAFAAGIAAALSLTTGLSSTLVGVMVAVALLPPAVTTGLMLGAAQYGYAYHAGLLLLTNIVCLSLAAQAVFFLQGIKPRTWYQQSQSRQSVKLNLSFWFVLLLTILLLIGFLP